MIAVVAIPNASAIALSGFRKTLSTKSSTMQHKGSLVVCGIEYLFMVEHVGLFIKSDTIGVLNLNNV